MNQRSSEAIALAQSARRDEAKKLALHIAAAALDKKALQVEIIDVEGKIDYADYLVLMSGRSDRQVNAIAKGVEGAVKTELGRSLHGREGLPQGNWALLDFGDVVVHIFHQDTRGYYDLEGLWIDAPRIEVEGQQSYPSALVEEHLSREFDLGEEE